MDTIQPPISPPPASTPIPDSAERAVYNARLFRSLATPSYLATPAKKKQASDLVAEAKAKGLLDSFEGMDEWLKTKPVKKSRNSGGSSVKSPTGNTTANGNEDQNKKEALEATQIKYLLEKAKKMILNRALVNDALPPFVYSEGNTRVIKQSSLIKDIEVIPQNDAAAWQELLGKLVEQKANPLAITWVAEHALHLSMTPAQQTLRQTAREQWQRLGSKQFNPVYASKEDLIALLTRK